jgi:tetratricopeptide (TPR) repeat protein
LGNMLTLLERHGEALDHYQQALAKGERLAADFPSEPGHRQQVVKVGSNLGLLLHRMGRHAEAEKVLVRMVARAQELHKHYPGGAAHQASLAAAHHNLAVLYAGRKRYVEAVKHYRSALALREQLLADHPSNAQFRTTLATIANDLGLVYIELHQEETAIAHLGRALQLFEQLAREFPTVPEYRGNLARGHNDLGLLLQDQGRHLLAEAHFRQSLALAEKLLAELPEVPQHRLQLALSCFGLGRAAFAKGQAVESLQWQNRALQLIHTFVGPGHRPEEIPRLLPHILNSRAAALNQLDRHEEALRDWERSLALERRKYALALAPEPQLGCIVSLVGMGNHSKAATLGRGFALGLRLANPRDFAPAQLAYYHQELARAFARCARLVQQDDKLSSAERLKLLEQYAAQAVQLLQAARASGFFSRVVQTQRWQQEPDWEVVRSRSDFQKLIREGTGPK